MADKGLEPGICITGLTREVGKYTVAVFCFASSATPSMVLPSSSVFAVTTLTLSDPSIFTRNDTSVDIICYICSVMIGELFHLIELMGVFNFALIISVAVFFIDFLTLAVIVSRKTKRLNPERHSLDYLRSHQEDFKEYFDEFPMLRKP